MAQWFAVLLFGFATIVKSAEHTCCLRTIERDIAILGGGGSGTYAAVKLREDFNTSIVVIEKESRLGGHVNTYLDPQTHEEIDYGVITYIDYGPSRDFFARCNVNTKPYAPSPENSMYIDIKTGSNLSNYDPPTMEQLRAALTTLHEVSKKYDKFLFPGFWNFPSPEDIPHELLIPFGEFADQYGVQAIVPTMTKTSNVGVGGIREVMTLYVLMVFSGPVLEGLLDQSFFVPAEGSNSLLYERAHELLKRDVLLKSRIVDAQRDTDGVQLLVESKGERLLIKAKKLLVTPPPDSSKLAILDLDRRERSVFDTFTPTWSFVGIIRSSSLPSNTTINFFAPGSEPRNYLDIRNYEYTLYLSSVGSQLFRVLVATSYPVTHQEAKEIILRNLQKSQQSIDVTDVEFVAFVDHNSVLWRQSEDLLRQGLVQDMYALQGHRSTYYTGGLWSADYSANVWAFTDTVLPMIVDSVEGY